MERRYDVWCYLHALSLVPRNGDLARSLVRAELRNRNRDSDTSLLFFPKAFYYGTMYTQSIHKVR